MSIMLTFLCGFLYEVTSTYWLFSAERRKPLRAGVWSLLQAVVMLTGISESINDLNSAIAFVAGYSIGSAAGVAIEKRKTCTTRTDERQEREIL